MWDAGCTLVPGLFGYIISKPHNLSRPVFLPEKNIYIFFKWFNGNCLIRAGEKNEMKTIHAKGLVEGQAPSKQ